MPKNPLVGSIEDEVQHLSEIKASIGRMARKIKRKKAKKTMKGAAKKAAR